MIDLVKLARRSLDLKDTDVVVPQELADFRKWVSDNQGKQDNKCTPWPGPCVAGCGTTYYLPSCPSVHLYVLAYITGNLVICDPATFERYNKQRLEALDFICNPVYDTAAVQAAIDAIRKVKALNRLIKASLKQSRLPARVRGLLNKEVK